MILDIRDINKSSVTLFHSVKVYVNDVHIKLPTYVDTEKGIVQAYDTDDDGNLIYDLDDEAKRIVYTGAVTLELDYG